jgi:hypothetical protein
VDVPSFCLWSEKSNVELLIFSLFYVQEDYMADRKGITAIVAIVVGSLSAILIIGIVDFFLMF